MNITKSVERGGSSDEQVWPFIHALKGAELGDLPAVTLLSDDLSSLRRFAPTSRDGWLVMLVAFEITLIGGGMFLFWWRFG